MIIVHVVAPAVAGGLERVVCGLAKGQRMAGHDAQVVAVFTEPDTTHPFHALASANDVSTIPVRVGRRRYGRERRAFAEICRRLRPDVVHTHGYRSDVVDGPVARSLGIPAVTTVHGFTPGGVKHHLYTALAGRAWRSCDAVIAVSVPIADRLARIGVPTGRVRVIRNAWTQTTALLAGEEARRELGAPADVFHIGWVGRLAEEKGLDVFLHALARLKDIPYQASVIGDGPERTRAQSLCRRLGLADRVVWHGNVALAGALFGAFDVYVLSSRTEGTPIALFEAISAGVPLVATQVGAVPDVVSEHDAILVPPDDPAALTQGMAAVFRDRAAAADRARRAASRVARESSMESWVEEHTRVYRFVRRAGLIDRLEPASGEAERS